MKIALIGRPNVGKSTLFNRLTKVNSAIVGDYPGITRDRKYAKAELFGIKFQILDTPGVDPLSKDKLALSMNEQSFQALAESDLIFFVIDAISGVTEYDKSIAQWLRQSFKKAGNKKIVIIKNKCDKKHNIENIESLGFGKEISVSAEHNLGFDEIYQYLSKIEGAISNEEPKDLEVSELKIAIVGRPNVGKSTLINAIIGENRLLTGDKAGITRDSISLTWKFKGKNISLIDTAGQRRKSKVQERLEQASVEDAWKYIRQANVVVIVMDIRNPFEKQDLTIARKVFDEGKIIIFALNKSDTLKDPFIAQKEIEKRLKKEFAQLPGVPCLLVSAKEKLGLALIFNVSLDLYEKWNYRISTGTLNKWFQAAIAQNPPPLINGMPIKLKYISQTNIKPPAFAVFANRVEHLPVSYERYLLNHLRNSFNLAGIPLRIFIRQRSNPFSS